MVRERAGERGGERERGRERERERERDTKGSRASAQNGGVPPPDTSKTTNAPVSTDEKTKSTEYRVERQRNVR